MPFSVQAGSLPVDEALQWVRHLWPQAESYLPELADLGYIRLSRAGEQLTLTEAGKRFVEGTKS
jgi:hypothetical protein